MLKLIRLDDRLVHGQILHYWCRQLDIAELIVADRQAAGNTFRRTMMEMAVPQDMKLTFCEALEAKVMLENKQANENVMLLFGNPFELLEYVQSGGAVESVNIGCMSYKNGKVRLGASVYADEKEIEALKSLKEKGIRLEIRNLPTDESIEY